MRWLSVVVLGSIASLSAAQNCANTSVGFTPLNDLGTGTYLGFQGGLYPGGSNVRPAAHDAAALAQAQLVVPRDASGAADPVGRIVFLSIGMSNGVREWTEFMPLANSDPLKDAHVQVVMGAQGGQAANVINDPSAPYWSFVDAQVAAAGATNAQVQVVWIKEAHSSPTDPFPAEAQRLRDDLVTILQILHAHFPNLRIAYLASRIYAGYATSTLNPEPYAYQSGFAVKWTIEQQLAGDPALNWDPSAGPVQSPLIVWGPYLWADGTTPRSDGLTWICSDYSNDGTHPNTQGSQKVANLLLDMCHSDPCASAWYVGTPPNGETYCTGDGLDPQMTLGCPCGNGGASGRGCASSVSPQGALLVKTGATNPDTVVLGASDMPSSGACIFLKGSVSPGGIVFGDGVRCLDGSLVRMALKSNVGGAAQFPEPGDPSVSVRGGTPPGSGLEAGYQTYYRNAASFCTPATFNVTNGIRLTW